MPELKFIVNKTARVFILGNEVNPKFIWIICHGYAQLAQEFSEKFKCIENSEHLFVFPEALNRFYAKGSSGRVGASWMTKEARLDDIEDNLQYLDKLVEKFKSLYHKSKFVLFGFSQGGATVCRWLAGTNFKIDELVIYGSVFPPDLSAELDFSDKINGRIFYVTGNSDQYISQDEKKSQIAGLRKSKNNLVEIDFEGDHDIYELALFKIVSALSFENTTSH